MIYSGIQCVKDIARSALLMIIENEFEQLIGKYPLTCGFIKGVFEKRKDHFCQDMHTHSMYICCSTTLENSQLQTNQI